MVSLDVKTGAESDFFLADVSLKQKYRDCNTIRDFKDIRTRVAFGWGRNRVCFPRGREGQFH